MRQVNSKLTTGIYSLLPSFAALIRGIWSSTAAFVEIIVTESLSASPRKLYCLLPLWVYFPWPASRITPDNTVTQCSFRSLGPVLYLPFLVHIAVRSFFFLRWSWWGLNIEVWANGESVPITCWLPSDHHTPCSTERANDSHRGQGGILLSPIRVRLSPSHQYPWPARFWSLVWTESLYPRRWLIGLGVLV